MNHNEQLPHAGFSGELLGGFFGILLGGVLGIALLAAPLSHVHAQYQAQPQSQAQTETLASGNWTNKGYDIHGNWQIVARGDKRYIVFDEDFKTRRGPDLKVYLSSQPLTAITDKTAAPNSVEIAPLKSARGGQEYEIPADIELTDYRSLLIHCKTYSHLWGGAEIAP